jgi:hypothetical protein
MKNNRLIPLAAALALVVCINGCGGGGSATSPSNTAPVARAAVVITELSVEGSDSGGGYSYLVRLAIQNSGAAPATLTNTTFRLAFGGAFTGTATVSGSELFGSASVAPGATLQSAKVSLDDETVPKEYATRLETSVGFTDSGGPNSATREAAIPPLPTPPATPQPPPPAPNPPAPQPPPQGICSPSDVPAGARCINNGTPPVTAICNDGAFSCSTNNSGTCSSHNGVRCRVCPGALCPTTSTVSSFDLNSTFVPWSLPTTEAPRLTLVIGRDVR